jgi:hypothetical protein
MEALANTNNTGTRIPYACTLTHMLTVVKEDCCWDVCGHDVEDYAYVWFLMDIVDTGIELPFHIPIASDAVHFPASDNHVHIICSETDHFHHHQYLSIADPLHL